MLLRILWRYFAESGELWYMIISLAAALFVILLLWHFSASEEPNKAEMATPRKPSDYF